MFSKTVFPGCSAGERCSFNQRFRGKSQVGKFFPKFGDRIDESSWVGTEDRADVGLLRIKKRVVPQLRPGSELRVQSPSAEFAGFHALGQAGVQLLLGKRPQSIEPRTVKGRIGLLFAIKH